MEPNHAQRDRPLEFSDWSDVLAASGLPPAQLTSSTVTVRWYLSFRQRSRVAACHQSAREFIAEVERQREPAA